MCHFQPLLLILNFSTGKRKRGLDGNWWMVISSKNHVHRWVRFQPKTGSKRSSSQSSKKKRSSSKKQKRNRSRSAEKKRKEQHHSHKRLYSIGFCEPYTTDSLRPRQTIFTVDESMYKKLLNPPRYYNGRPGQYIGNAFIFGHKYKPDQYRKIGSTGNDGAQVGFVDVKLLNQVDKKLDIGEIVLQEYEKEKGWENWKSRAAFARVRKQLPHILFIGETEGGDVGADLYAHYDKNTVIDSLLIDNDYFFRAQDDE